MQLKKIICHIMPEQYSILICDDHAILLEGLKVCLQRTPGVGNVLLCTTMHNAMQLLDCIMALMFHVHCGSRLARRLGHSAY